MRTHEFLFARIERGRIMYRAPRSRIEIDLVLELGVGEVCAQRHDLVVMRVPVNEIAGTGGAELWFPGCVLPKGILLKPREPPNERLTCCVPSAASSRVKRSRNRWRT